MSENKIVAKVVKSGVKNLVSPSKEDIDKLFKAYKEYKTIKNVELEAYLKVVGFSVFQIAEMFKTISTNNMETNKAYFEYNKEINKQLLTETGKAKSDKEIELMMQMIISNNKAVHNTVTIQNIAGYLFALGMTAIGGKYVLDGYKYKHRSLIKKLI